MAKTPRTWTGARTPSGLKRVRQAQSRNEVLQPRRSAAKTLVSKALVAATATGTSTVDPQVALAEALSAPRSRGQGRCHPPNAAARRKSRLTRKVNAALGGVHVAASAHVAKQTGKAAAQKAAKARIAAGKAGKAKGAQTAAGKARAACSRRPAPRPPQPRRRRGRGGRRRQGRDHEGRAGQGQGTGEGTSQEAGGHEEARREGDRQGRPGDRHRQGRPKKKPAAK